MLTPVVIEKWPQLQQKICYFAKFLNYCHNQIKKIVIKIGNPWL